VLLRQIYYARPRSSTLRYSVLFARWQHRTVPSVIVLALALIDSQREYSNSAVSCIDKIDNPPLYQKHKPATVRKTVFSCSAACRGFSTSRNLSELLS